MTVALDGSQPPVQRPQAADDEDELLRLQKEFEAKATSGGRPAAAVRRTAPATVRSSTHSEPSVAEQPAANSEQEEPPKLRYGIPKFERTDAPAGSILSGVAERQFDPNDSVRMPTLTLTNSSGFPAPKHRSVWAPIRTNKPQSKNARKSAPVVRFSSELDAAAVQENDTRIAAMSSTEIEEARKEILSKLDPSVISFLKSRNEPQASPESSSKSTSESTSESANVQHEQILQIPKQVDSFQEQLAEPEKLEWMQELAAHDASSASSSLRFDFAGRILPPEAASETPAHSGLFHHGHEAQLPGYSIDELAMLARSTVPMQRSLSIRILARIVARLHAGSVYAPDETNQISQLLRKHDLLLQVRVALDASHETVVIHALEALACIVGHPSETVAAISDNHSGGSDEDVLWDKLAIGRLAHRSFATSPHALALFSAKAVGKDDSDFELPENDGSLSSVSKLVQKDPIQGLISTHILVRIHFLLNATKLPISAIIDIVHILTAFARHSASAAQDILECQGLVAALIRTLSALKWPIPNASIAELVLVRDTTGLFRLLCLSGRDAASSVVQHGIIGSFLRYLTMIPESASVMETSAPGIALKYDIATQVWLLQGAIYTYGLGGRIFDEYRVLFFEALERANAMLLPMLDQVSSEPKASGDDVSERTLCSMTASVSTRIKESLMMLIAAMARAFSAIMLRFRAQVDAGGPNDAVRPYADIFVGVIEAFVSGNNADLSTTTGSMCVSSILDAMRIYISHSLTYQYTPRSHTIDVLRRVTATVPLIVNTLLQMNQIEAIKQDIPKSWKSAQPLMQLLQQQGLGLPLCNDPSRRLAHLLLRFGSMCDGVASALDFDELSLRHLANDRSNDANIVLTQPCVDAVRLITSIPLIQFATQDRDVQFTGEWMRVFGHGKPMLLFSWCKQATSALRNLSDDAIENVSSLIALSGVVGLSELAPGDEFVAAEWLNGYMFASKSRHPIVDMNESLARVFALDAFMGAPLDQSRALYRQEDHLRLDSLLFSAVSGAGSLPLRRDWVFGPIDRLHRELASHGVSSVPEDVESIVRMLLKSLQALALAGCLDSIEPAVKVVHIMRVFLLSDRHGKELFRDEIISDILNWCFDAFVLGKTNSNNDDDASQSTALNRVLDGIETAAGGGTSLYRLYQDLLDEYAGSSFSSEHFQKYLVVMLARRLPKDYRLQFWTTLSRLLRGFVYVGNNVLEKALVGDGCDGIEIERLMRRAQNDGQLVGGSLLERVVNACLNQKST